MKVFTATTDSLWHGPVGGGTKGGILGLRSTAVIALNASTTGGGSQSGTLTLATAPALVLNGSSGPGFKTGQLFLVTTPTMALAGADSSFSVLYGSTAPGVPELTPVARTSIIRAYSVSQMNAAVALQPTNPVCLSVTTSVGTGGTINRADLRGDNGTALQNAAVLALAQLFTQAPDIAGCMGCHYHEPNNGDTNPDGTAITGAQIAAETQAIIQKVKPMVNNGNALSSPVIPARVNPMTFGPIFASEPLFNNATNAQVDAWVYAGSDWIGQDTYAKTSDITKYAAQSTRLGIPWWVPELGTSVAFNPTDAQHATHMDDILAASAGANPSAFAFAWYDANHNLLDTNLSVNANAGETAITVNLIPGKAGAASSLLAGATIRIFGGTFEDVTTTGDAIVSGSNFIIIPVPTLAGAHAAGSAVWLFRNSVIKWRGFS